MDSPPFAIIASIGCGLLIPVLLALFGVWKTPLRAPGPRFKAAVASGWLVLVCALVAGAAMGVPMDVYDLLAATAVISAACALAFIAWSLIAWGFTLNMLLIIDQQQVPIDAETWSERYVGEGGIRRLTMDRFQVLCDAGFATQTADGTCVLTARGRHHGRYLRLLKQLFGITDID